LVLGFLGRVEFGLQIFEHAQIVERVDVAGDRQGQRKHMSPIRRVGRHEGWVGDDRIEVVADREALSQPVSVDFQHRHEPLRVQFAIGAILLRARRQVDRPLLIFDALEVERNPHPVGSRGAEIIIEDGAAHRPRTSRMFTMFTLTMGMSCRTRIV
jgi:hypothetical protein